MKVSSTSRAGGESPNQDRVRLFERGALLLDGASAVRPDKLDGGWYAERLSTELVNLVDHHRDTGLPKLLHDAISRVAAEIQAEDGSPSSTVVITVWDKHKLDVLVLGDSTAAIYRRGGRIEVIVDDRLDHVGETLRKRYQEALRSGEGFGASHRERLRELQAEQLRCRNMPGGYWIASTDPGAALEAYTRQFPVHDVEAVMLASDGFADAVSLYNTMSWAEARQIVSEHGPDEAVEQVRRTEAADPVGRRWPRSKLHDDKSVVLIELAG